jgi:hypothetical protein
MNPLEDIFGARVRGMVYAVYALAGLLIGSVQAAYSALPDSTVPDFITVCLAVYAYLGIALGFTAASNAKNPARGGSAAPEADATAAPAKPRPRRHN